MDLTTVARARARYLGDDGDAQGNLDAELALLVTRYSAEFELVMNRLAEAKERTVVFDVEPGQYEFSLAAFPVSAVASVKSARDRDFASATALDSDTYTVDTGGMLTIDRAWIAAGAGTLQVVYTGGMAASAAAFVTAFPDIADALDDQINEHLGRRDRMGSQSVSAGDGSKAYTGPLRLLPIVLDVLNRHRRFPGA